MGMKADNPPSPGSAQSWCLPHSRELSGWLGDWVKSPGHRIPKGESSERRGQRMGGCGVLVFLFTGKREASAQWPLLGG